MAAPPPPFTMQALNQPPPPPPMSQQPYLGFPSSERSPAAAPPPEPQVGRVRSTAPGSVTLLVRHLPEAMPQDVLARLFSYYGASSVRPCAGGRLRNCAFVDFANEALASQAQLQLNRLRFLGKVLSVERAMSDKKHQQNETQPAKESSSQSTPPLKDQSALGKLSKAANMNSVPSGEPIASRLGVDYPFPPHLKYEYPPPDGNILTNIVNALIAVPRFYTQVLHLMNKMNIPAPFRMALPTPPLPPTAPPPPPPPPPPPVSAKPQSAYLSSDESELESSEEDVTNAVHRRKRVKRGAIVGPAVDRGVAHEDVGLKPASLVPKEVPMIKKKNHILQIKIASKPTQNEFRDDDSSSKMTPEPARGHLEPKPYVTADEIEREKLPPEELLSLPMFKNYTPGNPATVLYIKNLAKDVMVDDFYFIFGSLFSNVEEAKLGLSVKLMQEGRMRGQAFVTFPSIDLAQRALNLVNGFVFKGKPMVIQFGRNPAAGKAA